MSALGMWLYFMAGPVVAVAIAAVLVTAAARERRR